MKINWVRWLASIVVSSVLTNAAFAAVITFTEADNILDATVELTDNFTEIFAMHWSKVPLLTAV